MEQPVILVIEDEMPLLKAIRAKLELNHFQVVTARSVQQALNHLKDVPDVSAIWLDHYLLGKEDGLDFVRLCKSELGEICRQMPIFVVSNTATGDKIKTYLELGVDKYYVKAEKSLDAIIAGIKETLQM